ncbi:MAG: hypothetical protein SGPRY_014706 [Prymnesium sp.]
MPCSRSRHGGASARLPALCFALLLGYASAGHPGSHSNVASHCVGCSQADCELSSQEDSVCAGCAICRTREEKPHGSTSDEGGVEDDELDHHDALNFQAGMEPAIQTTCKRKGQLRGVADDTMFCERWCKEESCDDCRCQLCEMCGGPLGSFKRLQLLLDDNGGKHESMHSIQPSGRVHRAVFKLVRGKVRHLFELSVDGGMRVVPHDIIQLPCELRSR